MNPVTRKKESKSDFLETGYEGSFSSFDSSLGDPLQVFWTAQNGGGPLGPAVVEDQLLDSRSFWKRRVERTLEKATGFFMEAQHPEGYWWAELESNVSITSEYLMLLRLLEICQPEREKAMVKYLLRKQASNGSWGLYYGDGGELSTTIEAYFALKLAGQDPASEPLRRAREFILARGGIESARVFTKIWLALFSQYDWNEVPSMPVELVLLPSHFYFSIYELDRKSVV